jgi:hypothetical protein
VRFLLVKPPLMMPSPPVMAVSMNGADCTASSRTMASCRPMLADVTSAKRCVPSGVSEKPTAGLTESSRVTHALDGCRCR